MTTFRYLITAEDAGDQIQHFLRFKQGISRKVVISLKHLPEGILLNGSHAAPSTCCGKAIRWRSTCRTRPANCLPAKSMFPASTGTGMSPFSINLPVCRCISLAGTSSARWPAYMPPCAKKRAAAAPSGAVNRIDKDTTGAVVVARHQIAAGKLWKAVTKRYVAVVSGVPQPPEGLIDLPLEREIPLEMKRVVSPDGERAVTEYKVLATAPDEAAPWWVLFCTPAAPIRFGCIWLKKAGRCWEMSFTAAPWRNSPGRRCTVPGSPLPTPSPGNSYALPLPCRRIWPHY